MTSIEFKHVCSFTSPLLTTQKSTRRAARDGSVTASACLVVAKRGLIFAGLSDGKILCWETDRNLGSIGKSKESKANRVLEEHKGEIRCMLFVESLCNGVMFTGSADRCIKMWDLSDHRLGIPCVQSLYGHGGTVLALESGSDMLLSSSTDGFLCVWRDQSPARLLRFPAFSVKQKITPLLPGASQQGSSRAPKETWFLSISMREGEALSIFAGDSEGYVHIYKPEQIQDGEADQLFLLVWKVKVHELGVSKIMAVPMESFLFTLSYDQQFKALDSLSGQVIFQESNQCNVVFHSLAWDSEKNVIIADEKGNVGFYNLYVEACVAWKNLCDAPILHVHFEDARSSMTSGRLLVLTPYALTVMDVVRGVKFTELKEHCGPVVSMASRPTPQGGLLYTASMDNTIRMWDTDTLECIKCLKEKKQEITGMVYLPRANVIVTGHENSDMKMWALDCDQEACLKTVNGQSVHTNTISALIWANVSVSSDDMKAHSLGGSDGGGAVSDAGFEALIAGSYDRQVSIWKVTNTSDGTAMGKFERSWLAHEEVDDEILAVAYSPITFSVFTGGNAGIIRKWSFWTAGVLEVEMEGHEDAVTCFAIDGNFLYSGSVDNTIRIWESSKGYELKVVSVHGSVTVQALLIIPDSGKVASCGGDGRIVFWDPKIGSSDVETLKTYEQPEEFRTLAYVSLNHTILVGCESGKIISFPLPDSAGGADMEDVPAAVSGLETPPSTRGGEGYDNLQLFKRE
eukprot:TRINITY_DN24316_c0_g1_i1.p1 TRINITY_DN24316_c0_g1~~TRINITY_DN24316_c0_g1_i1.p1  ORF type:complete len:783 (+),score=121.17 TRINITY_DN24316_c0_g1_i1:121-2349(+)